MSAPGTPQPQAVFTPHPRELDLFGFFLMLARHLRFIVLCGVVCFLAMMVAMLRARPRFSSSASMIIPQSNSASSLLAAQLSQNTADLLGGGYELYADMLSSRTVADQLIRKFDLMKVYNVDEIAKAEGILATRTKVSTAREGLLVVTVQDEDPNRAADLANEYLHQLDLLNSHLVLSTAGQERAMLERELTREKDALADAEVALKEVQENESGLPPEAQAAAGLTALETARAQLRADQIQLAALLPAETEQNPEIVRLRSQIAGLGAQVEQLQKGAPSTLNGVPTSKMPAQALEYVRRAREVKFHEQLFDLLQKQYEAAREKEEQAPSIVQVLDPAVPARHKSWPPRTYYTLLAGVGGLILGVFLVGLRAVAQAYARNPANAAKLGQLRSLWRLGAR